MCILNAFGTLNNVLPDIKLFLDRQFKNHPSTILVYHLTIWRILYAWTSKKHNSIDYWNRNMYEKRKFNYRALSRMLCVCTGNCICINFLSRFVCIVCRTFAFNKKVLYVSSIDVACGMRVHSIDRRNGKSPIMEWLLIWVIINF